MNTNQQQSIGGIEETSVPAPRPSAVRRARQLFRRLWRDQRGANALEYVMLATLVAAAMVVVVRQFGSDVGGAFTKLSTMVTTLGGQR